MATEKRLIAILERADYTSQYPSTLASILIKNGIEIPVRCKDCKHWWKENETCTHPKCCEAWMCVMQAPKEHFCSYGERKDNG